MRHTVPHGYGTGLSTHSENILKDLKSMNSNLSSCSDRPESKVNLLFTFFAFVTALEINCSGQNVSSPATE